jgi:hypothetical protein
MGGSGISQKVIKYYTISCAKNGKVLSQIMFKTPWLAENELGFSGVQA